MIGLYLRRAMCCAELERAACTTLIFLLALFALRGLRVLLPTLGGRYCYRIVDVHIIYSTQFCGVNAYRVG